MPLDPKEARQYALMFLRLAQTSAYPPARDLYAELANSWLRLAAVTGSRRIRADKAGRLREQKLRPKRMPQLSQRHLHRGAARTTTGRVRMDLAGSSYEIISGDVGRFPIGTPNLIAG
jgi:hypothetical protein